MKLLSILIILTLSIININGACLNCLNSGDTCDLNNNKCSNGYGCFYKNGDTTVTTCQKLIQETETCSIVNDRNNCEIGFDCVRPGSKSNSNRQCLPTKYLSKGQSCKNDYECSGSLICKNGGCYKDSILDKCQYDNDCKYNENCIDGYCNKISKLNEICKSGQCFYGQDCRSNGDSVFNTCQSTLKLSLGESCKSSSDYQPCNFNQNLYCNKNNICEKFIAVSSTNCTSTTCGDYQTCSCDGKCYQSATYPTDLPRLEYNLRKCAYDNKCVMVENLVTRQSCIADSCRSEICDLQHSKVNTEAPDSCGNQHIIDRYCNSSSKLTSIISLFSTLLLLIIYFIF